jgi:hypothetical protein
MISLAWKLFLRTSVALGLTLALWSEPSAQGEAFEPNVDQFSNLLRAAVFGASPATAGGVP